MLVEHSVCHEPISVLINVHILYIYILAIYIHVVNVLTASPGFPGNENNIPQNNQHNKKETFTDRTRRISHHLQDNARESKQLKINAHLTWVSLIV